MRLGLAACAAALAALACDTPEGAPAATVDSPSATGSRCAHPTTLRFVPDTNGAAEAYLCFGFDAALFTGHTLSAVLWTTPSRLSANVLHHATLYAMPSEYPAGPTVCDAMPDAAVGLHVWSVGGSNLELPADTGLLLPEGTRSFAVQAHTALSGSGPGEAASVTLCEGPSAPAHLAAFLGYGVAVPALRPMHVETAQGDCTLDADLHLWSVWPHMHLAGKEIAVELLHGSASTPLVDVDPWSFHAQRTYPLAVDALAGDTLRTRCTWQNTSASYIFPGPHSTDEMCTTGLVVWPAEGARCR